MKALIISLEFDGQNPSPDSTAYFRVTVRCTPNILERFFGEKPRVERYRFAVKDGRVITNCVGHEQPQAAHSPMPKYLRDVFEWQHF
ncbi:MAG: hypothetical protein KBC21_03680 [Candidatus Pacebacteria bacterium]|nr:hypothetical protein [Candidatus Paceibacterota bacterium]